MSVEEHKAAVRRHFDELWNQGRLDVADELYAPDFVDHNLPAPENGLAALKSLVARLKAALPDSRFTIEDLFGEGDRVAARWTVRFTHTGEVAGVPPTGRPVTYSGIDVVRFVGGRIAEHWAVLDRLAMLEQLGAAPARGQSGGSAPVAAPGERVDR
jgi:steroid delta-isomerase-like uncharacterized protein